MNAYGIIFSSYKYNRCTIQNEIWMCVSVLRQRYTRYTGEITWKTTSKTTESTSQNNRLFLKTNPLLLLQKQKQELLQRQQRKLSRKKIFLLVRRTSRPERSFLFLDRMILVKRRMAVQEAFALPWGTPPQLRIRSAAPPEVEPRALRAGLHHSSNHTVDVQTPPPHVRSAPPLPGEARALCAGRVRSSGYWLKSGVTGGCYPSLGSSGEAGDLQPGCPRITATILSRTIIG